MSLLDLVTAAAEEFIGFRVLGTGHASPEGVAGCGAGLVVQWPSASLPVASFGLQGGSCLARQLGTQPDTGCTLH